MKTKLAMWALVLAAGWASVGCTQNERARALGGTAEVKLPVGRKLVNVTWKETDLWFLTRATKTGEQPEVFEFVEKSTFGMMDGKVIIREQ